MRLLQGDIYEKVVKLYGLTEKEIVAVGKQRYPSEAHGMIAYLVREISGLSLTDLSSRATPGQPPGFFKSFLINACNTRNAHVQIVDEESVGSSTGDRSNYDFCNILSTPDVHGCKNLELPYYSNPIRDRNNVNGTNGLPKGDTTIHSRRRGLHQLEEQRKHLLFRAVVPYPEVSQLRWAVAKQLRPLHLPLPSSA